MKKHRKCDSAKYRKQRKKETRKKKDIVNTTAKIRKAEAESKKDREMREWLLGNRFGGTS